MFFLHSERFGFRLWTEEDFDLAMGLWGDPEVMKFLAGPRTEKQVRERLAKEIANMNQYRIQYWQIFLLSNNAHVGCCGLKPYKREQRIYEIGFHLKPDFWGQGLALEAARAVMDYACSKLNTAGLFAGHHPDNEPSRRILERLGFKYTEDEFYPPTGLNHPSYLLSAEEYLRRF